MDVLVPPLKTLLQSQPKTSHFFKMDVELLVELKGAAIAVVLDLQSITDVGESII